LLFSDSIAIFLSVLPISSIFEFNVRSFSTETIDDLSEAVFSCWECVENEADFSYATLRVPSAANSLYIEYVIRKVAISFQSQIYEWITH
jgi:hypothetical protein